MLLRLRRDFVIRKLDGKKGIDIHAALRRLKSAPFCIPTCSLRFGPFTSGDGTRASFRNYGIDWHIQREQDEKFLPAKNQAVSANR